MTLRLEVDGVPFGNFKSFSVNRSIETLCGSFSFTASDADRKVFPIKLGSRVKATVNDVPILTGFVESISPAISIDSHDVQIQGRDITADLVDSTLNAGSVEIVPPVSLVDVINKVQAAIGSSLEVVNNVPDLKPIAVEDLVSCKAGQGAFEFLEKFARKKQVLLNTDGRGRIVISRNSREEIDFSLVNRRDGIGNNVLSSSATYNNSERFNRYIVVAQSNLVGANNFGIDDIGDLADVQSKPAIDPDIRSSRVLYLTGEKNFNSSDAYERALWEKNVRRARAWTYSAKIQGLVIPGTDEPIPVNRLVLVVDEDASISAKMLIKSVSISSSESGSESSLELVDSTSYTLETSKPEKEAETNPLAAEFSEEGI